MFNIDRPTKGVIAIVLISALALFLLIPKKKGIRAPEMASDDKVNDLKNARVILDAYLNAKEAGESNASLTKLNSLFAQEYGLRVIKTKDKQYIARTLDGKDILMVK